MSDATLPLHPTMRFQDAAKPVILARLDDLFTHEAGTREGSDSEDLHDMRVASRRLRAAMDVFTDCFPRNAFKPLRKTAAQLTRALGEVRDLDVLIEELQRYRKKLPADERVGVDDLIGTLKEERSAARERMIATLDETNQSGFRHRLFALIAHGRGANSRSHKQHAGHAHGTLRAGAQRICVVRIADLYGFAPAIHDEARDEELHQMRIAAKRLRYSLEIFRVCFGPDIDERIADVKAVQEQVGQIHDCDVLVDLLRRHLQVLAQRDCEKLAALAAEPLPHEERMAMIRAALQSPEPGTADPRLGLLSLLGQKLDERHRRYNEFVRWWDDHDREGMRSKLYACITAEPPLQETA